MRRESRWIVSLVTILLLSFLAGWLRQSDLSTPSPLLPRCAFHVLTGWHCPGCGNTRAAHALLHGDLYQAARQNIVFVITLPFLGVLAWRSWFAWVFPGRLRPLPWAWRQRYTYAIVAFLLLYWVARNLPWAPFSWLAPEPISSEMLIKESSASLVPTGPPPDALPPEAH